MLFAERLLELLEHPIGANVEARSFAQEQLVGCLALVDAEQERTLSYDDWLTLHTAAAHSGTVVTRALREELGDLVEASLFGDAAMVPGSAAIVGRRARWALTDSDTRTLLDEYNRRPPYRTALVHVSTVSPTRIKLLASGLRRDRILSWRQAEVRLPSSDKEDWEAVAEEAIDWPWFSNKDGVLFSGDDLPSANELGLLWASIDSLAQEVCGADAKHVVLVPDATLSSVPWQAIALRLGPRANVQVSLLPGVGWFSAHSGDQLFHERGLLLWAAAAPTPTVDCDIRPELARGYLGREVTSFEYPQVAYLDNKSTEGGAVSLAVIVGHGQYDEADRLADATAVSSFKGWHSVRQKRVCVLLSCHTGAGTQDGLRDYIGLPTYLLRKAKVILAPPVDIPYTAAKDLAFELARSIGDSMERGKPVSMLEVYRNAMASNQSVSLFNLWGLSFEPVVWHSRS